MTSNDDADRVVNERARLEALAAFAPRFRQPDATPGEWVRQKMTVQVGVAPAFEAALGEHTQMDAQAAWFEPSELLSDFTRMAYDMKWVVPFDWSDWSRTPEGDELLNDRSVLAVATPEQLSKLLTAIIRADRFNEGTVGQAYNSGLLRAIAERASAIQTEQQ